MTPLLRHLPGQMPHFQSFVIQPNFKCLSSVLALMFFKTQEDQNNFFFFVAVALRARLKENRQFS